MAAPRSKKYQKLSVKKTKLIKYSIKISYPGFKKNMITEYITLFNKLSVLELFLQAIICYNF